MQRRKGNVKKSFGLAATSQGNKKGIDPKKVFFITLGVGVLGTAGYFGAQYLKKKKNEATQNLPEGDTNTNNFYILPSGGSSKSIASGNDRFPLKYGSQGANVRVLQEAVKKILGAEAFAKFTKVDGDFKGGTEGALKAAGLPSVIDEATFKKISSGIPVPQTFNPSSLALKLLGYARTKNFDGAISVLQQIKTTDDYSKVNEPFKSYQFGASMSIVTYLLDDSFANNSGAKEKIKAEFLRMGLKENAGKWSLSGIRMYKDIITLASTIVVDKFGRKIPVKKNTILGEEINVSNGMTYFKDVCRNIHSVPTRDVAYAK